MNTKAVVALVAGCIACVVCGFVLGYLSGSGVLSGARLSGAGFDQGQLALLLSQQKALDAEIAAQLNVMKERNARIRELNELLAKCRICREDGAPLPDGVAARIVAFGIVIPPGTQDPTWWEGLEEDHLGLGEKLLDDIKAKIDGLNADSQLEMVRLQSLIDKRNQAFEMVSKFIEQNDAARGSAARNMR